MHELFLASDNSQNIIRVLFIDFTKAFDVIDRNVLLDKFVSCGMPEHVVVWSLDFLSGRRQFVRIADSVSSISDVTVGTSQGTVSGPNDFELIINDLNFGVEWSLLGAISLMISLVKLGLRSPHWIFWRTVAVQLATTFLF